MWHISILLQPLCDWLFILRLILISLQPLFDWLFIVWPKFSSRISREDEQTQRIVHFCSKAPLQDAATSNTLWFYTSSFNNASLNYASCTGVSILLFEVRTLMLTLNSAGICKKLDIIHMLWSKVNLLKKSCLWSLDIPFGKQFRICTAICIYLLNS